jgi:hypothetical protein
MSMDQNEFRGHWVVHKLSSPSDKVVGYILENEVFINIIDMNYMRGARAVVMYYFTKL